MDRARLLDEIRRFDADLPVERAWMPPASWYTEPDVAALERDAVFAASWQPVARVGDLSAPGAFASGVLAGEPWLVVRGDDDVLRAFSNTCRHKGREVVQGRGCAAELVCGYHAWTYDLAGGLRRAPEVAGIEDFDRGAHGLVPLACEVWGPWVFVNLDGRAAPLGSALAPLTARLDAGGWGALRFVAERRWSIACDWKVVVDNYLDGGYHIPHMHPSLDAQLDMGAYRTELFERFSVQGSPAGAGDGRAAVDPATRIGDGALYAWLHPNLMLNRYGPCLDTNHVLPAGPGRCEVVYEFWFAETEGPEAQAFIERSIAQSDVTQREDIAICESVQLGLGSRHYDRGRYAPRLEHGEHHFHRLLQADYLRALTGAAPTGTPA